MGVLDFRRRQCVPMRINGKRLMGGGRGKWDWLHAAMLFAAALACGQTPAPQKLQPAESTPSARPKLVVMIMVDQMRADYVDKFRGQWSSGLKRLVDEGAWFRVAAYPYAATETCAGHATISTGAFPSSHGIDQPIPGGTATRKRW